MTKSYDYQEGGRRLGYYEIQNFRSGRKEQAKHLASREVGFSRGFLLG